MEQGLFDNKAAERTTKAMMHQFPMDPEVAFLSIVGILPFGVTTNGMERVGPISMVISENT